MVKDDDDSCGAAATIGGNSVVEDAVRALKSRRSDSDEYCIDETPRQTELPSSSAQLHGGPSEEELMEHEITTAMSTGESSRNSPSPTRPSLLQPQPSFAVATRRSNQVAVGAERNQKKEPRYMHPQNREVDPRLLPPAYATRDTEQPHFNEIRFSARPQVATAQSSSSARVLPIAPVHLPPRVSPEEREVTKRQIIEDQEKMEFADLVSIFARMSADIKATLANRERYLTSEEYQKFTSTGRARRLSVEEREVERKRAEVSECTFEPHISRHAAKLPHRSHEAFFEANKEWQEKLEKKRRAASAVVFRESDMTFAPQVLPKSKAIVDRLQQESKHRSIVECWSQKMEEHKKHMRELQEKYSDPFFPQTSVARGRAQSQSPKRVATREVVGRLYHNSLEHKKVVEAELETKRRELSPQPSTKRSEAAIKQHLLAMNDRTEKMQRKLKVKRLQSEREERELEHNCHAPLVNPNSTALAMVHRQRAGEEHALKRLSSVDAGASAATHSARPSSNIYELLYQSHTRCSEARHSAPRSSESQDPHHQRPESRGEIPESTAVVTIRSAPHRTKEFLLRNEKLLQNKQIHAQVLKKQLEEEEGKECTFAPQISSTTARLAVERRSQLLAIVNAGGTSYSSNFQQQPFHVRDATVRSAIRSWSGNAMEDDIREHHTAGPSPASIQTVRPPTAGRATTTSGGARGGSSPPARRPASRPTYSGSTTAAVGQPSEDSLQLRLDEVEGLLKEWKWLEESSRM